MSVDHGPVDPFGFPALELRLQAALCHGILGEYHQAGRVLVDTVHDQRPAPAGRTEVGFDLVVHGRGIALALEGNRQQARGLAHHEQHIVLEDDVEVAARPGAHGTSRAARLVHPQPHGVGRKQPCAGVRGDDPIHVDLSAIDRCCGAPAGSGTARVGEELVEADARILRLHRPRRLRHSRQGSTADVLPGLLQSRRKAHSPKPKASPLSPSPKGPHTATIYSSRARARGATTPGWEAAGMIRGGAVFAPHLPRGPSDPRDSVSPLCLRAIPGHQHGGGEDGRRRDGSGRCGARAARSAAGLPRRRPAVGARAVRFRAARLPRGPSDLRCCAPPCESFSWSYPRPMREATMQDARHPSAHRRTGDEVKPVMGDGTVKELRVEASNRARDMIESFMIAANGATARFLTSHGWASIRRVVAGAETLAAHRGDRRRPRHHVAGSARRARARAVLDRVGEAADPRPFSDLSLSILKLLGRGEYIADGPGRRSRRQHFALAESNYTHSTAPNRRFPDLVTQRLVKGALGGATAPYTLAELTPLAEHCTKQEDAAEQGRAAGAQVGRGAVALQPDRPGVRARLSPARRARARGSASSTRLSKANSSAGSRGSTSATACGSASCDTNATKGSWTSSGSQRADSFLLPAARVPAASSRSRSRFRLRPVDLPRPGTSESTRFSRRSRGAPASTGSTT